MRLAACACGGLIALRRAIDIEGAVQLHNRSLSHAIWRYSREGPTASTYLDLLGRCPGASALPVRPAGLVQ